MNQYKVIISDLAKGQIKNAKRYIKVKFKNPQALKHLSDDIKQTKDKLKYTADSCPDYDISKRTKKIHLSMNYKFIFSIQNSKTVLIEEFLHDLQDK